MQRGPAPGSLASHLDIGLEVRDDSLCTVECLLVHCLEIGLHVRLEPLLDRRGTVTNATGPKPESREKGANANEPSVDEMRCERRALTLARVLLRCSPGRCLVDHEVGGNYPATQTRS